MPYRPRSRRPWYARARDDGQPAPWYIWTAVLCWLVALWDVATVGGPGVLVIPLVVSALALAAWR